MPLPGLSMEQKQLIFKMRIQLDNIYFRRRVTEFSSVLEYPTCVAAFDTLKHFLTECTVTQHLRSVELALLLSKFYEPVPLLESELNSPVPYRILCLNLR